MSVRDVQRYADEASASFDRVDFVHEMTRDGLLSRLQPIVITAKTVVDLGTATGSACRPLARHFRRAHVIGVDLSLNMLAQARKKRGWFTRHSYIQADAEQLPFADHSIDVVFANLLLPWVRDPGRLFDEVARVLRKDGVFTFSTLGPDSLLELRQAWSAVVAEPGAGCFPDMHDLGDVAVRSGLRDPVLDVDRTAVSYASNESLSRDLRALGAPAALLAEIGKTPSARTQRFDLELVFGHCWGSGPISGANEYRIDPAKIRRRPG
jgi:malonyl-CoA O-methyltransferase